MNIVFINSIFPNPIEPNKGNFILKNLLKYPSDIKVSVIAPVPWGLSWRRKKAGKVPHYRQIKTVTNQINIYHPRFLLLPRNILRPLVPFIESILILPTVFKIHRKQGIDILHANFASPDGIACRYVAQWLKLPFLITEHQAMLDSYLTIPWLKNQMAKAYRDAGQVICVSQHTQNIILTNFPHLKNTVVIPNGIDLERFKLTNKADKPKKLIYVGYLVQHKGIHILLKAMKILIDGGADLQLTIVGEGNYGDELTKQCKALGLTDIVDFVGEKTADEVAEILYQHDILVHPSFIESFGIVVVEALAAGLPVVATINGGSESILTPETGVLVQPQDEFDLAAGILKLISNWANYTPEHLRSYVQSNFSRDYVVGETIKCYQQISQIENGVSANEHNNRNAKRLVWCKSLFKRVNGTFTAPGSQTIPKTICHLSSVHIRSDVRVFYKQCTALKNAGFKVHLVVADGQGNQRKNGILIHDVGSFDSRKKRFVTAPILVLLKAISIQADAYQIHDPELIPIAIMLKLITHKPIVYDIHECYPEMFLHKDYISPRLGKSIAFTMKYLERFAIMILDSGIAATEHIAQQFSDIPIIHNYPIISEWTSIGYNPLRYKSKSICYLGSITKERGLTQLIKAIENVDCVLHLAGSYEPLGYRNELINLPGWSKVKEYGYVNRTEAAEIFSKCALGVVLFDNSPNHLYSLSTKMFEYMAAGLPIMVSNLPANVKLLDRAGCGIYVDSTRIPEIAKHLSILLSEPEKLQEMGAKGREMINSELSWEAEEKAYVNLYRSLLNWEIN